MGKPVPWSLCNWGKGRRMSNILTIPVLEPAAIVRPEGLKSNAVISPSWFPSVATLDLVPEGSSFSFHSRERPAQRKE